MTTGTGFQMSSKSRNSYDREGEVWYGFNEYRSAKRPLAEIGIIN
jgi:hypothetical protein